MQPDNTQTHDSASRLALGLGWFSIGLGLAEILAPRAVARAIGMPDASTTVLRSFGAREIASGLAILTEPNRATWLWSRVAGDAIDLSYLGAGLSGNHDRTRVTAAMGAVMGVMALDILCARQLDRADADSGLERKGFVRIERVTTINRPVDEVYAFWRRFENFPRFMRHLESVETLPNGRTRWVAKAPAGMKVEWQAELVEDRHGEWIAWRSVEGSGIQNSGSVRFTPAPGARGTEVRVQLQYSPPAGAVGRNIAWLFGQEPEQQIHYDLHRFKQLMETGEIPLSDGPGLWRAAQPADPETIRSIAGVER